MNAGCTYLRYRYARRKNHETENPHVKLPSLSFESEAAIVVVLEERNCRKGNGAYGSGSKSRPSESPGTFTATRSDGSRAYFEAIAPS
jgi:hypothetical protein